MNYRKGRSKAHIIICLSAGLFFASPAAGQEHTPYKQENKWLVLAEEQFQQGHYTVAAQSAMQYMRSLRPNTDVAQMPEVEKARFYLTVSNLRLETTGAVDSATGFIATTPNATYKQRAAYALAQHFFSHNQYISAIPYYEMADIANLSNKEIANSKFELAYCYFNSKQFDRAAPLFASIKELEGKYYAAGNYYHGLLAYNHSNYPEALQSFERIANEKEYKSIVPYYIAEIYYFTGDRERAFNEAMDLVKRPEKSYYHNELHLLIAQILFEDERYGEALPYFEQYYNSADKIRKEDLYEMAYCYYRVKEWKNAIDKFKPLSNAQDSLGQTAMYLLGDCYLKTGDKKSARNAFSICANMSFNPAQQEAAMLLTARLSYEMGYNDEAISYVNALLNTYPNSSFRDDAKTLLSDLLIKTSNYREAYDVLADVTKRDAEYRRTYQKVTYGYAMTYLQNGNYHTADSLLEQSLKYSSDNGYQGAATFWKGDVAYKLKRYADAIRYSKYFISQGSHTQVQYLSPAATLQNAYLNIGYSSMELGDFAAAQDYFSKAQQTTEGDGVLAANAILREADAVFMQKEYAKAISLYDKVIALNKEDADYARFQKAIIMGLQGKNADKAAMLQSLISSNSAYATNARYELALVYIEDDKYQQAISMLEPLTGSFEGRAFATRAWMKIGFAYQQLSDEAKAIEAYKHVVLEYPGSEERPAALDALKSLYIQTNQPASYTKLLKEANLSPEDNSSADSTYYAAAEAQFSAGNWQKAKQAFGQYLANHPTGVFVTKAHYYKGESHYNLKEYSDALKEYDALLNSTWNQFSENSSKRAASIAYLNKDYQSAINYYTMLRNNAMSAENLQLAYSGLMQSNYHLKNFEPAYTYADTLSTLPDIDENTMADVQLFKARSLQQANKQNEALTVYRQLETAKKSAVAAEARYQVAAIYLQQNKLKEAEEAANNTIRQSAGNDYWVVKSYILLADVLAQQKDYFNAKATLQSIVKNTKIAELKEEATKKLAAVKELEKKQSKLSED